MKHIARTIAAVLFVALVPVILIASSVRLVINLPALYSYGFDRYGISDYTGIGRADLIAAGAKIRDYFNNDEEDLIIRTFVRGALVESLYNAREIHHMRDVKALVRGVYIVQTLTALYIGAYIAVGFALYRGDFWQTLGRSCEQGRRADAGAGRIRRATGAGRLQPTIPAVSPYQLQQRLLDARPAPRLPHSDVPAGLLL